MGKSLLGEAPAPPAVVTGNVSQQSWKRSRIWHYPSEARGFLRVREYGNN